MKPSLEKILNAAFAWGRAERRLRSTVNYAIVPASGERKHRIVLDVDWTEQALLEAVEEHIEAVEGNLHEDAPPKARPSGRRKR